MAAEETSTPTPPSLIPTYIRAKELSLRLGIAHSSLWKLRRQPSFPRAIIVNAGTVLFVEAEILGWLEERRGYFATDRTHGKAKAARAEQRREQAAAKVERAKGARAALAAKRAAAKRGK